MIYNIISFKFLSCDGHLNGLNLCYHIALSLHVDGGIIAIFQALVLDTLLLTAIR
jgi:hypothetical protein